MAYVDGSHITVFFSRCAYATGTWSGITNNLDLLQDMGMTAVRRQSFQQHSVLGLCWLTCLSTHSKHPSGAATAAAANIRAVVHKKQGQLLHRPLEVGHQQHHSHLQSSCVVPLPLVLLCVQIWITPIPYQYQGKAFDESGYHGKQQPEQSALLGPSSSRLPSSPAAASAVGGASYCCCCWCIC